MEVTWEARFYLTNRRDSVPIIHKIDDEPAWDNEWTKCGSHGWHKAQLFRHGPLTTNVLIDLVYSQD